MKRNEVLWTIIYYVIVFLAYWLMSRDGPPLRVAFWYNVAKWTQRFAHSVGRVGLDAERQYYRSLERSRA